MQSGKQKLPPQEKAKLLLPDLRTDVELLISNPGTTKHLFHNGDWLVHLPASRMTPGL